MNNIIIIGSSNTDMVFGTPKMPQPGETVIGSSFDIIPGGKGANQAVAAARAGAEVVFIAKVGKDDFGNKAIAGYQKDNINTNFIFRDKTRSSGVAMIMVEETTGENSIIVAPGANGNLSVADIQSIEGEIKKATLMLIQLEVPLDTVHAALKIAKKAGITTILNPAPAQLLSEELLALVDIITPNETETKVLIDLLPSNKKTTQKAAALLLEKVNKAVIITLGDKGVYYCTKTGAAEFVPTTKVKAVDTTAAGDVFNGYLAAALAAGKDYQTAIQLANKAATISVTRKGAQPSVPFLKEVQ